MNTITITSNDCGNAYEHTEFLFSPIKLEDPIIERPYDDEMEYTYSIPSNTEVFTLEVDEIYEENTTYRLVRHLNGSHEVQETGCYIVGEDESEDDTYRVEEILSEFQTELKYYTY